METFVVQRCLSLPPSMGYTTLENTLDQWEMRAMCTIVQQFKDSNERRDWPLLLQVISPVNKCEAMFSSERLKIFKCTWIKCLLETNLASSMKTSYIIMSWADHVDAISVKIKYSNPPSIWLRRHYMGKQEQCTRISELQILQNKATYVLLGHPPKARQSTSESKP